MSIHHYIYIIGVLLGAGLGYGTSISHEFKETILGASVGLLVAVIFSALLLLLGVR